MEVVWNHLENMTDWVSSTHEVPKPEGFIEGGRSFHEMYVSALTDNISALGRTCCSYRQYGCAYLGSCTPPKLPRTYHWGKYTTTRRSRMFEKILDAIHARTPGETILVATGSDGIVILRAIPMAALLVYRNHDKKPLVQLQVVRGGLVMFKKEDYEKWAEECIAAREGKSPKLARPRPWKKAGMGGSWQQK